MNPNSVRKIEKQIYRQFPEVSGKRPKIIQQKSARSSNFLLTFNGRVEGPGGNIFKRTVRVVADDSGRILKVTTSR